MPGEDVQSWSPIAVNNGTADTGINWIEGMPRADVNNSARSVMAAIAKDRNLKNGSIVTAGTANAQIFSSGLTPPYTTVPTGMRVKLKIGAALTNTDAATLSMDGITAVAVKDNRGLPVGAGVLLAGAYLDFLFDGTNWIILTDAGGDVAPQCGRLTFVSVSSLKYAPYAGDGLKINGQVFRIPAAGIAGLANTGVFVNGVAGQNLAADTLYYVYAFSNAAVVTADFRTGGHSTSSTLGNAGVEILTGDDSRSLIGMIKTWGTSFMDDLFRRFVISWFNRRNIASTGPRITSGHGSTVLVEHDSNARAYFCTWGEEAVSIGLYGSVRNEVENTETIVLVGLNGVGSAIFSSNIFYDAVVPHFFAPIGGAGFTSRIPEGGHYITPLSSMNGGAAIFDLTLSALVRG